jgi:hypothetical protein
MAVSEARVGQSLLATPELSEATAAGVVWALVLGAELAVGRVDVLDADGVPEALVVLAVGSVDQAKPPMTARAHPSPTAVLVRLIARRRRPEMTMRSKASA